MVPVIKNAFLQTDQMSANLVLPQLSKDLP